MMKLVTTLGGSSLESFDDLFPLGNMPHGINGKGLAQSRSGFHVMDLESRNLCGEIILDFNFVAFLDDFIMVIEVYYDDMTISFRSRGLSMDRLPKCFYEAHKFIANMEPEKSDLIQAILLSEVGSAMFFEEIGCSLSCQEEAIKLFNAKNSAKV
jgi:hypothetical protein